MAWHGIWNIVAGLGYFWAIVQLLEHYHPIRAGDDTVVQLTGWHFIAYIEPTELRPDCRSIAMCVISKVYRKKPDSVSLPHCPSQCRQCLEDCYKAYHRTRSSAITDRPCYVLRQSKSSQLLHNWTIETSCVTNQSNGVRGYIVRRVINYVQPQCTHRFI